VFRHMLDFEPCLDALTYILMVGSCHAIVVGISALVFVPRLSQRGCAAYILSIWRVLLFNTLLLLAGVLANGFWMTFIYDHMYVSQDTTVDFIPFIPFGQWVLNMEWGGKTGILLNGTKLWQLRAIWLLMAFVVWLSTVSLYRRWRPHRDTAA